MAYFSRCQTLLHIDSTPGTYRGQDDEQETDVELPELRVSVPGDPRELPASELEGGTLTRIEETHVDY